MVVSTACAKKSTSEFRFAFANRLPLVGSWGRRPLELATLRLQNMMGVSIANWAELKPADAELQTLTQLGGMLVVDAAGNLLFDWKDPGICAVANFEDVLDALKKPAQLAVAA